MDLLTILPEELIELLITYLDGLSTHHLGSTCSILHLYTSLPKVWRRLLARTRITTITREVEKLAKGDLRAIYFLSHQLRKNWGSGVVKEEEVSQQASRMFYGPNLQRLAANESWAARVNLRPTDQETPLLLYDLIQGTGHQGINFGEANLHIGDAMDLPGQKIVEGLFVLDSFIVILKSDRGTGVPIEDLENGPPLSHTAGDMMVFSIQDRKFLYNQETVFGLRDFMRGIHNDVTHFKDYIAAFRMKTITLHQVMADQVVVKELGVGDDIRGIFQYHKFMTWNETHMAHPFQAHPGIHGDMDVQLQHRIYCWDQKTWEPKIFVVEGHVNNIFRSLALHNGKLFAAQAVPVLQMPVPVLHTVRIWDLETGALEKVSMLDGLNHLSFLITEGIGIHLHPATQHIVGVVSTTRHSGDFAVPTYSIEILNFEGELLAILDIPKEKEKRMIVTRMVGPRLVVLYSDNSYSVVDLELETSKGRADVKLLKADPQLLKAFPLGSAHKKGTLVSERSLVTSTDPNAFAMRSFSHVSQFNIVISHSSKYPTPKDHVHTFSFL